MKPLFTKSQARAIGRAAERSIHKRRATLPAENSASVAAAKQGASALPATDAPEQPPITPRGETQ